MLILIKGLKDSFFSLFFIMAPHNAQVDVAVNVVRAKRTANIIRIRICPENEDRNVEYNVNPYTAAFGLNS